MAILSWISDELTILAEAFGEPLTEERVEIYARGLIDIPRDRLEVAFRRALYEVKWFPKLSELRELSGSSADDQKKVEAQAAWNYLNKYLAEWGVDRLPVRSGGQWITAPPLEPRLEYALRQIGGLWRFNQVTDESYPFIYRDFCEAYTLAPVAELMAPQLSEQFGDHALAGNVKRLTESKTMEPQATMQESLKVVSSTGRGSSQTRKERREQIIAYADAMVRCYETMLSDEERQEFHAWEASDAFTRPSDWPGWAKHIGRRPGVSRIDELTPERKAELRRKLNDELAKRKNG